MASSKNKAAQTLKYIALALLAALLVYIAFRKVDWAVFLDGLSQTRWVWILLFLIASVGALFFRAVRWREMMAAFDGDIKLVRVWDALNVGNVVNTALPGAGEIVRTGYVTTKKLEFDKALGTMLCERIWDIIALVIMLAVSIIFGDGRLGAFFDENVVRPLAGNTTLWWVLAAVAVAIAVVVVLVRRNRQRSRICGEIADSIGRLWAGVGAFGKSRNKLLIAITTVVIWVMYILMSWCILRAMPVMDGLGLLDATFIAAIGGVASAVPVPGSIGAFHYLVAATIGLYGISWDMGILYATLYHEIHAVFIVLLGLACYLHMIGGGKKTDNNETAAE